MRALIFLLSPEWTGIARLPKALGAAGFDVSTLSTDGSFLSKTRYADRHSFMAPGTLARDGLRSTLAEAPVDLIIPGCGIAVDIMQRWALEERSEADGGLPGHMRALLRRSLGDPAHYHVTLSKHKTVAAAQEAGIRVPAQAPVTTAADVHLFAEQYGYPAVLKAEFGNAGTGVRICNDAGEVAAALAALSARPKNVPAPRIFVQQYIAGRLAMGTATALGGTLLDHFAAIKRECHPAPTGPSSVVEFVEHADIARAMTTLVKHLGFSGFGSADFIVDNADRAWLIEFNPRPTPVSHLAAAAGHDLCRALWCALSGVPYPYFPIAQPLRRAAMFPNELLRDANSPWLANSWHDIPHDDPELLAALQDHVRRTKRAPGSAP